MSASGGDTKNNLLKFERPTPQTPRSEKTSWLRSLSGRKGSFSDNISSTPSIAGLSIRKDYWEHLEIVCNYVIEMELVGRGLFKKTKTILNLQLRADILSFHFDDGEKFFWMEQWRVKPDSSNEKKAVLFSRVKARDKSAMASYELLFQNKNARNDLVELVNITHSTREGRIVFYKPVAVVGAGRFGKVFLVNHVPSGIPMAMKTVACTDDNQQLAMKERLSWSKITLSLSPFIVKLLFAFQEANTYYYVSEFCSGGDLVGLISSGLKLDSDSLKFIICEIVSGVLCLHQYGIVHRDLKPENILLTSEGHIKIADLGLATLTSAGIPSDSDLLAALNTSKSTNGPRRMKSFSKKKKAPSASKKDSPPATPTTETSDGRRVHRSYSLCGTSYYFAPEMIRGTGYHELVDWWQVGCVIQELLTGVPAFCERDSAKREQSILEGKSVPVDPEAVNAPVSICTLIRLCLDPDPETRLNDSDIQSQEYFDGVDWDAVTARSIRIPDQIRKYVWIYSTQSEDTTQLTCVLNHFSGSYLIDEFNEHDDHYKRKVTEPGFGFLNLRDDCFKVAANSAGFSFY